MSLLPYMASFVASYVGWALGRPLGIFAASMLAILAGSLGFYYSRKYVKELIGR